VGFARLVDANTFDNIKGQSAGCVNLTSWSYKISKEGIEEKRVPLNLEKFILYRVNGQRKLLLMNYVMLLYTVYEQLIQPRMMFCGKKKIVKKLFAMNSGDGWNKYIGYYGKMILKRR